VSAGHVLVARLDNDGDVLLCGPAVRAVAAGSDRVTMLCGPRGRRAAELLPGVDALLVHRAAWIDLEGAPTDRAAMLAFVDELAALEVDEAIVFVSFHQSALPLALLLRMAGVPRISAISEDFPGALLDLRHRDPGDVHEVQRALSLVRAAGFELPPGDAGRLEVRHDDALPEAVAALGAPYVVVHPGASVQARSWSPARHRALVDALAAGGRRVVVTGAPSERELCAFVARSGDAPRSEVLDLGGATSLGELAEVVAAAACVVVGNTGPRTWPPPSARPWSRSSPRPSRPSAGARGRSRTSCSTSRCRARCAAPATARSRAPVLGGRVRPGSARRCGPLGPGDGMRKRRTKPGTTGPIRVAMVSEHASPLATLGGADAGGQNVHVAALAQAMAAQGADVVIHTRRDAPKLAPRVPLGPGVVVDHVDAGPPTDVPKDELCRTWTRSPRSSPTAGATTGRTSSTRTSG
jgi:ADP-heptose:LPS heptosyltransferase